MITYHPSRRGNQLWAVVVVQSQRALRGLANWEFDRLLPCREFQDLGASLEVPWPTAPQN